MNLLAMYMYHHSCNRLFNGRRMILASQTHIIHTHASAHKLSLLAKPKREEEEGEEENEKGGSKYYF